VDRSARLLGRSTHESVILEVGAGYNPVAPKAAGWRTHVVDHADQETLRAKYARAAVNIERIEPVDTVWTAGSLDQAVPPDLLGRFDTMIVSHVLEHMPDLIGFLESAVRLMRPDGVISVALPDRRYCFDCLKPPTTTADLLEAHRQGRTRHAFRTAWNHLGYSATLDGALGWNAAAPGEPRLVEPLPVAHALASTYDDGPAATYVDFHCWFFTPAGFRLAMLELGQVGAIDWVATDVTGTMGHEFFAVLRRGVERPMDPERLVAARMALMREQLQEQLVVINRFCPTTVPVEPAVSADDQPGQPITSSVETLESLRPVKSPSTALAQRPGLAGRIRRRLFG
jgi:SAM-dependent methyltransferase